MEKKLARKVQIRKLKIVAQGSGCDNFNDDDDLPNDIDLNDTYFAEEFAQLEKKEKRKKRGAHTDEEEYYKVQKEVELACLLDDHPFKKFQASENE